MNRVAGRRWPYCGAKQRGDATLALNLGNIAAELHGISFPTSRDDDWERRWRSQLSEVIDCIVEYLPNNVGSLKRCGSKLLQVAQRVTQMPLGPPVIVHGDLDPSNCLFDRDHKICGLVDFQQTFVGPATVDFRCLPALDATSFLAAYEAYEDHRSRAIWLGWFFEALFEGLALVIEDRFVRSSSRKALEAYTKQFPNLLEFLTKTSSV